MRNSYILLSSASQGISHFVRTPSNRLFIYDPLENQWHEGKQMPTARGALTANFVNGMLYAIGDQSLSSSSSPSGILTTNEPYDTGPNTWTTKAAMPTARHHTSSSVVNGKLYAIDGRVEGISPTVNVDVNEVYTPEKKYIDISCIYAF